MPAPDDQPPAPETAEPAGGAPERPEAAEGEADSYAARRAAIEAMLALRDSGAILPVTREEILAWRHEGHKY
jgi:hypothetical protein